MRKHCCEKSKPELDPMLAIGVVMVIVVLAMLVTMVLYHNTQKPEPIHIWAGTATIMNTVLAL